MTKTSPLHTVMTLLIAKDEISKSHSRGGQDTGEDSAVAVIESNILRLNETLGRLAETVGCHSCGRKIDKHEVYRAAGRMLASALEISHAVGFTPEQLLNFCARALKKNIKASGRED